MEWNSSHFERLSCSDSSCDIDVGLWMKHGLIPWFIDDDAKVVTSAQLLRLRVLCTHPFSWNELPPVPDMLFVPTIACGLGPRSCLVEGDSGSAVLGADPTLLQLLPVWASIPSPQRTPLAGWELADLAKVRLYTVDANLWNEYQKAMERITSLRNSRTGTFSRSAYYMGSKSSLAPQLCEIAHAFAGPDTCMVDLMCGSGAMSGAFARNWRTVASDAQTFSRLLARVQGGGMTHSVAVDAANAVLTKARGRFEGMSDSLRERVHIEDEFMHSELTASTLDSLVQWLRESDSVWQASQVNQLHSSDASRDRYTLFLSLYGNLFFGLRQAYEIDCLRYGIDQIDDPMTKEWALGALICAVSACAFSYGGHFAQPKLDLASTEKIHSNAAEMLQQRTLSVSHEFYVRFVSLADESASIRNVVETVDGPWEKAISGVAGRTRGQKVCVYLDPPYTRDEYSRYYHVLETLALYDCKQVTGKARIPARGSANRFASIFNSRLPGVIEEHIGMIISACLAQGWSCLWSYSDTGLASIDGVLQRVTVQPRQVELFAMNHTYKAQGKRGAKKVVEHAIYLSP